MCLSVCTQYVCVLFTSVAYFVCVQINSSACCVCGTREFVHVPRLCAGCFTTLLGGQPLTAHTKCATALTRDRLAKVRAECRVIITHTQSHDDMK